jgi:hypothetical protein
MERAPPRRGSIAYVPPSFTGLSKKSRSSEWRSPDVAFAQDEQNDDASVADLTEAKAKLEIRDVDVRTQPSDTETVAFCSVSVDQVAEDHEDIAIDVQIERGTRRRVRQPEVFTFSRDNVLRLGVNSVATSPIGRRTLLVNHGASVNFSLYLALTSGKSDKTVDGL